MPTEPVSMKTYGVDPIVVELGVRVTALEKNEADRNTEIALIKKDLSYIKEGQDRMNSGLNKVFWLVVAGILAAIVNFVVGGGLHLPTP